VLVSLLSELVTQADSETDRYIALQNDALGHGPLASYFKGEDLLGQDAVSPESRLRETKLKQKQDILTANLYLAEDRILVRPSFSDVYCLTFEQCWELIAKAGENWVLKYVSSAQGETDVPDTAEEWISQRRRWLNGSFFAAVYAQTHILQIFKTDHSWWKKFGLLVESRAFLLCYSFESLYPSPVYQLLNLVFSWFALANFYIFFIILTSALEDKSFGLHGMVYVNMVAQYLYAFTLIATFVFSMGNRPQPAKWQYMACMASFTLLTAYMMGAAIYCIVKAAMNIDKNPAFPQIVLSLAATYGAYALSSFLHLDPWHLVTSMGQ
jgi:chitin synthase